MESMFSLEKFTGENDFALWRTKIKALMEQQGVGDAFLGEDNISDSYTEMEKKNMLKKAHSILILNLGDSVLKKVLNESTFDSLWLKLEEIYMNKSFVKRISLKQKLFSYKMDGNKAMKENIDDFYKILYELESIDIKCINEDLAMILYRSLPECFSNMKSTLFVGRDSITLEEIVQFALVWGDWLSK